MLRFLVLLLACFASAMRGASAAACADRPTLKLYSGYSSSGTTYLQDEVKYVQNKVGVTADGYYGSGTESAVKSYQRKRSLTADGIVGKNTWQWLCNDYCKVRPTLRYQSGYSSTGTVYLRPFVRYVQGKVGASKDGYYGAGTQSKVEAFQKSKCLSRDGITGPNTWRALCTSYTTCGSTPPASTDDCTFSQAAGRGIDDLCANQVRNAQTIIRVGRNNSIPRYGWIVAIAAALVESRLVNINGGDRDSVGLFQQRCEVGWCKCGSGSECLDPVLATRAFYGIASHTPNRGLTDIDNWQSKSVSDAAQAVQVSCCPDRYGEQEALARQIVSKYE